MENVLEKYMYSEIESPSFFAGSMFVFEGVDPLLKVYGHVYPKKML